MNPFQLMAKPTGSMCNLDCQYCFYLEKPHQNQRAMSDEVLARYIQSYLENAPQQRVTFLWQGGEPTMAGLDFYQRAVDFQRQYANGKQVENALQTNGVLLDADWCRFLYDNRFLVGLSVDGPQHLHDTYRLSKSGKGTFRQVMDALDLLINYRVQFNTLTVVHNLNVRQGKEIYRFLKRVGSPYMQFIPLMGDEVHQATASDYGQFLVDIFDEWYANDVGKIGVQFIEQWFMAYLGLQPDLCIFRETCGDQLVIEQNGDIYSCDHYVYPEYKLGNLIETPLRTIAESPTQIHFGSMKSFLSERCQRCKFHFACHGGCPKHRTINGFGAPHNQLCEAYYRALCYMDPYLHQFAADFKRR
ncbi:anaerobic sulfatase maturase [Rodentibacter trehalosifermentans]|uniref:Anaerobic sulfatase maturase n=1 Tax=Rodentibacter trehalosifermentans TaxID=1908263 RepID=A0A1V3J8V1_9PAST|nr:anaerobic sulfatase maturase [Rodentibacter trehalosifermentans]OOF51467.1 anaerobic sulfatase maturase [Rodentibacter trehalosifermentans]